MAKHGELVTLRLPVDLVKRLKALAKNPAARHLPELVLLSNVSRSAIHRLALMRGLDDLESEIGKPEPARAERPPAVRIKKEPEPVPPSPAPRKRPAPKAKPARKKAPARKTGGDSIEWTAVNLNILRELERAGSINAEDQAILDEYRRTHPGSK